MNNLRILLLLGITSGIFFMNSCKKKVDGFGVAPGFEKNPIILNGEAQEILLKAKNDVYWFIDLININNEGVIRREDLYKKSDIKYYSLADTGSITNHLDSIYKLESKWFVWEKINSLTIKITVTKNEENKPRIFDFRAVSVNALDQLHLIQYPLDK